MFVKATAILLLSASLFLSSCQSDATTPGTDPKNKQILVSLSTAERAVVKSDNGFGFRLFASLATGETKGNLIVSPLSVSMALTMAYNGARNATETAMGSQLGFGGMDRAGVNAFYARLIPALMGVDPNVKMQIANSVWTNSGFPVEADYLQLNRDTFGAEVQTLDFAAPQTATIINDWVKAKTNGLIPSILVPPLDPTLEVLLINALYFKGNWSLPFDPKRTYDGEFHLADGTAKTCRMMNADNAFLSFADGKVNALELPYGDSLYSMVFLQPVDTAGMPKLIADLGTGSWDGWEDKFVVHHGPVQVPKFKLEYKQSLTQVLQSMGMGIAFSDAADFTGIHKEGGLAISDVLHKTYVNVDEKGTEAAAVTAVMVGTTSIQLDLIKLDRPFVFILREKSSGTVLFLGRIMDPTL